MLGRRIAGLLAGVMLAVLSLVVTAPGAAATTPAAASAAPSSTGGYPAQSPLLTVSSGSVKVGSSVTVTGRGFQAGESVDISVTYASSSTHALGGSGPQAQPAALTLQQDAGRVVSAAHALAAQDGVFTTKISLTQTGNATITATGELSHMSLTAAVTVLALAPATAKQSTKSALPLPSWVLLALLVAIIALLVPAGIVLQRRSRKPAPLDPFTSGIGVS